MKIGSYELSSIETGEFALDGGAMFGVVPKPLWQNKIPVDEQNRISLNLRCLLLQSADRKILIDTGIGHKGNEKFQKIFRIDHSKYNLEKSLNEKNLSCDDITDVILTHLHFDHVGGATKFNKDKKIELTFKNATHYIQKEHLAWAKNPSLKDRASFLHENISPLETSGKLELLDGEVSLFENIKLKLVHGHTPYQQLPLISDEIQSIFYCADLAPSSTHIPIPWVMSYDNEPLKTIAEKEKYLNLACKEDWILFFEHCPYLATAKIRKSGGKFEVEKFNL